MLAKYEIHTYIFQFFSYSLSLCFLFFSIGIFIYVSIQNQAINPSLPFRLSILILIVDLLFSLAQTISFFFDLDSSPTGCLINEWINLFTVSTSMFYAVSIAAVFLATIVYEYKPTKLITILVYIVPILLSMISSLLPIINNKIDTNGKCTFITTFNGTLWLIMSKFGSIFITILLCPILYVLIIIYLLMKRKIYDKSGKRIQRTILPVQYKAYLRLLAYPAIPILCYSITIVISILIFSKNETHPDTINLLIAIGTLFLGLQGFFNSLLFLSSSILLEELDYAMLRRDNYFPHQDKVYFVNMKNVVQF